MTPVCIDFETYWKQDEYSVAGMAEWNYTHDPRFDAYLVSVVGEGVKWVGHPKDFDWGSIRGRRIICHNARFDSAVAEAVAESGGMPAWVAQSAFGDTADLSAYSLGGRSLAEASETLLGPQAAVDKRMRTWMSGKTWADAEAAGKATALKEYALNDSVKAMAIWEKYSPGWSDFEQRLSEHTRKMTLHGIRINRDETSRILGELEEVEFACRKKLPWVERDGEKAQSADALKAECRRLGIEPPASTADDDERFHKWLALHEEKVPFVGAFKELKKINTHKGRLESMLAGSRPDNDRWSYGIKYMGALPTGRWAAGGGSDGTKGNVQNQNKDLVMGKHDFRSLLVPAPGKKFIIADYSSIEPIVTAWYVNDRDMLEAFEAGGDIYEAYARSRKLYTREEPMKTGDKALRNKVKMAVIACAYQIGAARLNAQYPELSLTEAEKLVKDYRASNPKVLALWNKMDRILSQTVHEKGDHRQVEIVLPSGRSMRYLDVVRRAGSYMGRKGLGKRQVHTNLYPGRLTNALIQGTARDILGVALLRLEDAGIRVSMHVHDEIIAETDADNVADAAKEMKHLMEQPIEWAPGLPLRTEQIIADYYQK